VESGRLVSIPEQKNISSQRSFEVNIRSINYRKYNFTQLCHDNKIIFCTFQSSADAVFAVDF